MESYKKMKQKKQTKKSKQRKNCSMTAKTVRVERLASLYHNFLKSSIDAMFANHWSLRKIM